MARRPGACIGLLKCAPAYPGSLRGRSTAAATRDQPVHFGIAAGAQGTHPGLVGAPKLSSVVARYASRPPAVQAPSFALPV